MRTHDLGDINTDKDEGNEDVDYEKNGEDGGDGEGDDDDDEDDDGAKKSSDDQSDDIYIMMKCLSVCL